MVFLITDLTGSFSPLVVLDNVKVDDVLCVFALDLLIAFRAVSFI